MLKYDKNTHYIRQDQNTDHMNENKHHIRYDTIRYDTIDLRALKSWRDGQLNLANGPETKNNEKIKIENRVAQKKHLFRKMFLKMLDSMCGNMRYHLIMKLPVS